MLIFAHVKENVVPLENVAREVLAWA